MTKQEIIKEFDLQILIQNEYIKGYKQLDFNTDTEQKKKKKTREMLEELKSKILEL